MKEFKERIFTAQVNLRGAVLALKQADCPEGLRAFYLREAHYALGAVKKLYKVLITPQGGLPTEADVRGASGSLGT